ncbi:MAG: MFS transporter [Fibrobacter sp.]|nr:MFS transporter [Fibrobacter sp.]
MLNKPLIFAIIAMALLMNTIDATIVATALHTLQIDLQTTVSWAGWTMTIYSLGFVLMLPLSAKLSTRFGHKRIFLLSVGTFSLASLLCALSPNVEILIATRALQAIGGAGITPAATGIIVNHFGTARDKYLGLIGSTFSIGTMIGPVFGSIIVSYFSWQWIFLINLPVGLVAVLLGLKLIPADKKELLSHEALDFKGLIYLAMGILTLMYGATYLGEHGLQGRIYVIVPLVALSILAFSVFAWHIKRSPHPFIHPRLIVGPGFAPVNLLNIINAGMVMGAMSLVPFYAVNRYGITELRAGTILVAQGISAIFMSILASLYIRRTGYRKPLYAGALALIFALIMLAISPKMGIPPVWWLAGGVFIVGWAAGTMSPAARNAGIQLAPQESANIAAIRSLGLQFGHILTVSISTALITAFSPAYAIQALVYAGLAVLVLSTLLIIPKIPENHGHW